MKHSIRDHDRDLDIKTAYLNGDTLRAISMVHGVSRERIRQILERLGVERRSRGRRPDTFAEQNPHS